MSIAQDEAASAAGRSLARARWGSTVVRSAVQTLADRRGELDEALKAELRAIAGDPRDGDDAV
jgi:hypothetical protein